MRTIVDGGKIVNEGRTFEGAIVIEDDVIRDVIEGNTTPRGDCDQCVDATGCYVLPGVIDEHVHCREPGLTRKADLDSESRAAAAGGVTSLLDMPNCLPQTTTAEALAGKMALAADHCHVNYGFFPGATTDNLDFLARLDPTTIPGVKVFMGASTGDMLVDGEKPLRDLFALCSDLQLPLMAHCESTPIINRNMEKAKALYGDDPDVTHHAEIRSEDACCQSSAQAIDLAEEYGTRLHIAHITTARELDYLRTAAECCGQVSAPGMDKGCFDHLPQITGEVCLPHLQFTDADYATLGTRIKCNPAVKSAADRAALRQSLTDGTVFTVATDHAPHEWTDKQGGCAKAASGMPMVQFSLVAMLTLVDEGVLGIERLVELMAHNPARLFSITSRGFLRKGYKADLTLVRRSLPWTVTMETIESKCKWSPLEGERFQWRVATTICNGRVVYDGQIVRRDSIGEALKFRS